MRCAAGQGFLNSRRRVHMWGQSAESLQMTDGGQSDGCRFRIHPAGSLENKNKKNKHAKNGQVVLPNDYKAPR